MTTSQSSDGHAAKQANMLPPPETPLRHASWFMRSLWVLAGFLVALLVYSFSRIATVPSPELDVPATTPTAR